jgi:hypothetical protein
MPTGSPAEIGVCDCRCARQACSAIGSRCSILGPVHSEPDTHVDDNAPSSPAPTPAPTASNQVERHLTDHSLDGHIPGLKFITHR